MNKIGMRVLSSYEKSVLRSGRPVTEGDRAIDAICTQEKLKAFLGSKVENVLEDGTVVESTAEEMVIAAAIGDAIEKGSFDKVLAMMKATKQLEDVASVVAKVDLDLEKRAIG